MKYTMDENKILIQQDELDIYDAPILKDKLSALSALSNDVSIDLQHVTDVSTPIIQILLAAEKSPANLKLLNIKERVRKNFQLFGFSI